MAKHSIVLSSLLAGLTLFMASCSKDDDKGSSGPATYVVGVGITTSAGGTSSTVNYVVKTNSLTTGTISPVGNGLTLTGYLDYTLGNTTVFAIGGLGVTDINGIDQDASGNLIVSGSTALDKAADDALQVDNSQLLAIDYPAVTEGNQAVFNFINISSKAIAKTVTSPVDSLIAGGDYPLYTGIAIRGSQMFIGYMHFDDSYNTNHVDTNYIAVYSYPDIKLQTILRDPRTGPTGAWNTKNGLFLDEKGDIYSMSSSNLSNGFSKATKPGGFLRIKSGATAFDNSYFFNTDNLGGKISHIKYIGNGLVFATISTLTTQTADDRWGDKKLKMAIIDVYNQKITDVTLEGGTSASLIHDGNGGRSFPVLVDNGKVYYTATIGGTTNIYEITVASATAKKGAQVDATFVGGIFKIK